MATPSAQALDLPPDVPEAHAHDLAMRHAPTLKLHRDERHFPSSPVNFRTLSRFRESRFGPDRGWHKPNGWTPGDVDRPPYYDIPWPTIVDDSLGRYAAPGPFDPDAAANLRPRDFRNVHSPLSSNGLFLQREAAGRRDTSGHLPVGDRVDAPLFLDVARVTDTDPPLVKVLYWFFYELNWWRVFYTHQGDWEHVTLVWTEAGFRDGGAPGWGYFAQHNGGLLVDFADLEKDPGDPNRPVGYVDPAGHPTRHEVDDTARYPFTWRTWQEPGRWISQLGWRDFAGAWGEVGSRPDTTGPLGPRFKRHRDSVRARIVNGRVYAVVGKS